MKMNYDISYSTMRATRFSTTLVAGSVIVVGCKDESMCKSDAECKGDRICVAGACADPDEIEVLPNGPGDEPDASQQLPVPDECTMGAPAYSSSDCMSIPIYVMIQIEDGASAVDMDEMHELVDAVNLYYEQSDILFYITGFGEFSIDQDDDFEAALSEAHVVVAVYGSDYYDMTFSPFWGAHATLGPTLTSWVKIPADTVRSNGTWPEKSLAHELGHTLGLNHPHGDTATNEMGVYDPMIEPLDSDCYFDAGGDLLCDTPPDPYGSCVAWTEDGASECSVMCDEPNQDYAPDVGLIMSYYNPSCQDADGAFSQEEMNTMRCIVANSSLGVGECAGAACGNGLIDPGEDCDGDFGGADCISEGFNSGMLGCDGFCKFDYGNCCSDGAGTVCVGNDVYEIDSCGNAGELVDACVNQEFCVYVDVDAAVCQMPPVNCGNGALDPGEGCDGGLFAGGATCASEGYGSGVLGCNPVCQFDYSQCCTSHESYQCSNNDVFWYDSCGQIEGLKESCGALTCVNVDAQTAECVDECGDVNYWSPVSMMTTVWDSTGMVAQLRLEVEQSGVGAGVRHRVCKIGGTFNNDINSYFEDWVKYNGAIVFEGDISAMGAACSNWADLSTNSWMSGDGLGGEVRVVSPDYCAPQWGSWCSGGNPGCGTCWFFNTGVMTRTCKN